MSTFDTALRSYRSLPISVFPLAPNAKAPMAGSHGFLDARPIDEWDTWPADANVGVATGMRSGGIVVIDLDGAIGSHSWAKLVRKLGLKISTLQVTTPHGRHLYFRAPVAFGSNAGVVGRGIDVRAEGGYVVGAGSIVGGLPYSMHWDELQVLPPQIGVMLKLVEPNLSAPQRRAAFDSGDLLSGVKIVRDQNGRPRAVLA